MNPRVDEIMREARPFLFCRNETRFELARQMVERYQAFLAAHECVVLSEQQKSLIGAMVSSGGLSTE